MILLGIAIGLIAWAIVLLVEKPTPTAGAILFSCQLPFAFATLWEYLAGNHSLVLTAALILDIAFAGIAWVLFLIKRKNQGN